MTAPTDLFAVGPTPLTDNADLYDYQTAVEVCQRIERRMRAAEKLLDTVDANHALQWAGLHGRQRDVRAHLEAARREDAK